MEGTAVKPIYNNEDFYRDLDECEENQFDNEEIEGVWDNIIKELENNE